MIAQSRRLDELLPKWVDMANASHRPGSYFAWSKTKGQLSINSDWHIAQVPQIL